MRIFTIDEGNDIRVFGSKEEVEPDTGAERFGTRAELARLARHWPMARLVAVWNSLPGVTAVRRFTDRNTAANRIWQAVQQLEPVAAGGDSKAAKQRKERKTRQKDSGPVARAGSRTEQIIALLRQPEGATLEEVMAATGWQSHSVRAFVSATLPKKKGLAVESLRRDGRRVYRIQG